MFSNYVFFSKNWYTARIARAFTRLLLSFPRNIKAQPLMFLFIKIDCKIHTNIYGFKHILPVFLFSWLILPQFYLKQFWRSFAVYLRICKFKRCKLAGRRTKSINIAAKNPRKAQSENLQYFGLEKIRQFVYPHSSFTRGRVFHFTPFIRERSFEKQNTRRVWVCGVSDNLFFEDWAKPKIALRITSD